MTEWWPAHADMFVDDFLSCLLDAVYFEETEGDEWSLRLPGVGPETSIGFGPDITLVNATEGPGAFVRTGAGPLPEVRKARTLSQTRGLVSCACADGRASPKSRGLREEHARSRELGCAQSTTCRGQRCGACEKGCCTRRSRSFCGIPTSVRAPCGCRGSRCPARCCQGVVPPVFVRGPMAKESSEAPNATPCGLVLFVHGIFLAACGIYGAWANNFEVRALHSAYAGIGGLVVLHVSAALTVSGSRTMYMIGVHVALLLQVLFVGVFSMQTYKSFGVPEKADRLPLFIVMGVGSAFFFGLMLALKPKKKKTAP